MYVKIAFTKKKEKSFKWFQVPTDSPQEAAMFGFCYCSGYNDHLNSMNEFTTDESPCRVAEVGRNKSDADIAFFLPNGNPLFGWS